MPDPLDTLEERFAAVLATPPGERAAFLQRVSAENPALATEISTLLKAYETADGDFLEDEPAGHLAAAGRRAHADQLQHSAAEENVGARIGRYRLIEKIGEGGCGVVYLAEQEEPVQRRVALKIIKLGMDTRAVVARFEAERQALAMMEHPNIARVFDAGETERGRPFFVMELVDGVPITRLCDDAKLSLDARLELFAQVCHAIQHAHQKGVIHRDIKPSNILVARQDGTSVPKIIDFGIAKATEARLTTRTLVTEFAQFVGTPAYMSPEQLDFGQADIDTRSDVYALGVLLYELLTGRTPFPTKELLKEGFDGMRRRIREEEPPRPSAAIAALPAEALRSCADHRGIDAPKLAGRLRGELDWIVMRCLEKDRAQRYPTASALADDVRRYLNNEPVTAVAPGGWYTFKKFARRHRAAFAAGLAFATLLIVAGAVSTWLAARATQAERLAQERLRTETAARGAAERERGRATAAEQQAKAEAARAAAINDFLQNDILAQADPRKQQNRNLTVRDAVDAASRTIDWKFVGQPMVELSLRESLGRIFVTLGEYHSASIQFERAILLAREQLGAEHARTLTLLTNQTDLLRLQGRIVEAEALARELLGVQTRVRGSESEEAAIMMHHVAALLIEQGRAVEAEPLMQKVVATHTRTRGPQHVLTLNARNTLANALYETAQIDRAEALHREVLQIRVQFGGPENLDATYSMNGLASVRRWRGDFAEAIDLQRKVLDIRTRVQGPDHPETIGAQNNLALTLAESGAVTEALELAQKAYEGRARMLGLEHPFTISTGYILGGIYRRLNRLADAEKATQAAVETARRVLGPSHPNTLLYAGALADVLVLQSNLPAAMALLRENIGLRERAALDTWPLHAERALLGAALAANGDFVAAEPLLRDGINGLVAREEQMPAAQRVRIAEARERLVALYEGTGRREEAARWRTAK